MSQFDIPVYMKILSNDNVGIPIVEDMLRLLNTGKELDQFFMYLDVQEMKIQSSYVHQQWEVRRFVLICMMWACLVQTVLSLKIVLAMYCNSENIWKLLCPIVISFRRASWDVCYTFYFNNWTYFIIFNFLKISCPILFKLGMIHFRVRET